VSENEVTPLGFEIASYEKRVTSKRGKTDATLCEIIPDGKESKTIIFIILYL